MVKLLILDSAPASMLAEPLRALLQHSLAVGCEVVRHPKYGPHVWNPAYDMEFAVGLVLIDQGAVGHWLDFLAKRRAAPRTIPLIAVMDRSAPHELAALLRAGMADYILPPLEAGHVLPRLLRLLPDVSLRRAAAPSPPEAKGLNGLIGRSAAFAAEMNKLPVIAHCDTGVLIDGETGTGKELFARAIHKLSPRAAMPFVPVNCGAIPVELAESELFGHERGAFTGAFAAHKGLIAQADGGTLFLDEVASLPLLTQVKLLRFLQEKEYRPIGSTAPQRANVRVIAAANTQLEGAVHKGQFRQDLFYRLNIIRVSLPPLRQRRDDIPLLASFFLRKYAAQMGTEATDLDPAAGEKLLRHDWPGNVRELEHVIERAVVFAGSPIVRADQVTLAEKPEQDTAGESFKRAKAKTVADFERSYIEGLLAVHRGNISHAARRAGKNRRAFWELIRKYGVDAERFRPLQTVDG